MAALWAAMALLAALSLATGPAHLSAATVAGTFFGYGTEGTRLIVWDLRLPRVILSVAIGATLGMAGAAVQGFARNPLASAEVLGVPAFASLGAVTMIYFGGSGVSSVAVPAAAILTAFGGTLFLFALTRGDGGVLTLVLAGLALSSLAGALTSLVLSLAPNPYAVTEIAFWLLGSLNGRSFVHVWLGLPFMVVSWAIFLSQRRTALALTLGDTTAQSLGVAVSRAGLWLAAGVACGVGASVAVAGGIGFIGLVVPHLVRPFFGYDPSRIAIPSALAGAILLTAADILVRVILPFGELKVGVVTSLVGLPFFLTLLMARARGALSGM